MLVLDGTTRDVVAPILRVADLRRHGVTLHLQLAAERQVRMEEGGGEWWKTRGGGGGRPGARTTLFPSIENQHTPSPFPSLPPLPQPIPDVPAVYFVAATPASIDRIAADAAAGTYEKLYINFCGGVPAPLLARLASAVAAAPPPALAGGPRRLDADLEGYGALSAEDVAKLERRIRERFARPLG